MCMTLHQKYIANALPSAVREKCVRIFLQPSLIQYLLARDRDSANAFALAES